MTNRKKVLLTVGAALVTVASAAIVADAVVSGPSCGSSPAATPTPGTCTPSSSARRASICALRATSPFPTSTPTTLTATG